MLDDLFKQADSDHIMHINKEKTSFNTQEGQRVVTDVS